jgi:hypothetical protein
MITTSSTTAAVVDFERFGPRRLRRSPNLRPAPSLSAAGAG